MKYKYDACQNRAVTVPGPAWNWSLIVEILYQNDQHTSNDEPECAQHFVMLQRSPVVHAGAHLFRCHACLLGGRYDAW